MKKFTLLKDPILLFLLVMLCILSITFLVPKQAKSYVDRPLDLIEITDFHGELMDLTNNKPVAGVLTRRIKEVRTQNPEGTLIIGGGDLYAGNPLSFDNKGIPVQKVLNNIGMQVTTLGNHELDWTLETLNKITMKDAHYSIVCSNVRSEASNRLLYPASRIFIKNGVRIAVIGAITTATPRLVLEEDIKGIKFTDPAEEINREVARIKKSDLADIIVAAIHEGDRIPGQSEALSDIADKLKGVDVVFGGHTHNIIQKTSKNGIPVLIGGCCGKGFIDLKLVYHANKTVTFQNVNSSYVALDNEGDTNGIYTSNPIQDYRTKMIVDKYLKIYKQK